MRLLTFKVLRESSKRRFSFIPNICTLANAFLGFLAVLYALDGNCGNAARCIVLAACMDMLDGRLARLMNVTSSIGMELDSLCDAVSFCCVPAIVMHCWYFHSQGWLGLAVLSLYLWCGLFRLARFNTIAVSDTAYFTGLPTTCAALCVASLLMNIPMLESSSVVSGPQSVGIMGIVMGLALLMVSSVQFPSGKRMPRPRTWMFIGIAASALGVCVWLYAWPLTLVVPFCYVIVCLVFDGYRRLAAWYLNK